MIGPDEWAVRQAMDHLSRGGYGEALHEGGCFLYQVIVVSKLWPRESRIKSTLIENSRHSAEGLNEGAMHIDYFPERREVVVHRASNSPKRRFLSTLAWKWAMTSGRDFSGE